MTVRGDFDPELYLRLLGERALLAGQEQPGGWQPSPVAEAARALRVIDAVPAEVAQDVVGDYGLASAVRQEPGRGPGLEHFLRHNRRQQPAAPEVVALGPRRTFACRRALELPQGTVEVSYVTIAAKSTRLGVRVRASNQPHGSPGGPAHRRRRRGAMWMMGAGGGATQFNLSDDRGTVAIAGFSGGGSDEVWEGHLTTQEPLSIETEWLELNGVRLELTGEPLSCEIGVEPVEPAEVAHRYMWQIVADASRGPRLDPGARLEIAHAAFVAAGHLEQDDLVAQTARYVTATPLGGPMRGWGPAGPGGSGGPGAGATPPGGGEALPDGWRSLLSGSRRHSRAPVGSLVIGAVTPPVNGLTTIAIDQLESDSDGFAITIEITPGDLGRHPFDDRVEVDDVTWWAKDDRGGYHLGGIDSWSGGEGLASGTVSFWPALDPRAKRLRLMPTKLNERAVIEFDLAFGEERR